MSDIAIDRATDDRGLEPIDSGERALVISEKSVIRITTTDKPDMVRISRVAQTDIPADIRTTFGIRQKSVETPLPVTHRLPTGEIWIDAGDVVYILHPQVADRLKQYTTSNQSTLDFQGWVIHETTTSGVTSVYATLRWPDLLKRLGYEVEAPTRSETPIKPAATTVRKPRLVARPPLRAPREFDTRNEALIVAMYEAHRATILSGNEYGGLVFRMLKPDGKITHTYRIKAGGVFAVDVNTGLPKGATLTAIYHSHPSVDNLLDAFGAEEHSIWRLVIGLLASDERYSGQDLLVASENRIPLGLATPLGRFRLYTPASAEKMWNAGRVYEFTDEQIAAVLDLHYGHGRYQLPFEPAQ